MRNKNRIKIKYEDARPHIQEADILMFRGDAWYSWFIKKITQSEYSHIGLASWHNGNDASLELIEFHGFRGGGAITDMDYCFPKHSGLVDVYRPASHYDKWSFSTLTHQVNQQTIFLDPKAITNTMRHLSGLPYGWRRIWWFMKIYFVGLRLCYNLENLTSDEIESIIYPVCSTSIAYCFNKNNFDLIKNKSDAWTQPSDLGKSPLLNYMFTLC